MTSLSKITLIGNVGKDPDARYTGNGKFVANFSVAVNGTGSTGDETTWFRIAAWEKMAEFVASYITKGCSVFIEGPLTMREYTGKDGQQHISLDVSARDIQLLGRRPDTGDDLDDMPF